MARLTAGKPQHGDATLMLLKSSLAIAMGACYRRQRLHSLPGRRGSGMSRILGGLSDKQGSVEM